MTIAKRVMGMVRFGDSFPVPSSHQTVRIFLTDMHNNKIGLEEIRATDVHQHPRSFSFMVGADMGYQIWAEIGTIKTELQTFSLSGDQELASIDLAFE